MRVNFLYLLCLLMIVSLSCGEKTNVETPTTLESDYAYKSSQIVFDEGVRKAPINIRGKNSTWKSLADIPVELEGASVACIGNKIYTALGYSNGDSKSMYIYDIDLDIWATGADAPGSGSEGAGIAHGGIFYTIGGRAASYNALWAYNPQTDVWTILPDMPTARGGLGVAQVGNYLYAIGGRTGGTPNSFGKLDVVERYDIDHQKWERVADLPFKRSDLAAIAHGGKIYVFGGFNENAEAVTDVEVYDPKKDSWSSLKDMPTARGVLYAVAEKGGTVYVLGGYDGVSWPGTSGYLVEAYKISKDKWITGFSDLPIARAEAGVVSHGGRIYMVGGAQPFGGSSIASVEMFKP